MKIIRSDTSDRSNHINCFKHIKYMTTAAVLTAGLFITGCGSSHAMNTAVDKADKDSYLSANNDNCTVFLSAEMVFTRTLMMTGIFRIYRPIILPLMTLLLQIMTLMMTLILTTRMMTLILTALMMALIVITLIIMTRQKKLYILIILALQIILLMIVHLKLTSMVQTAAHLPITTVSLNILIPMHGLITFQLPHIITSL